MTQIDSNEPGARPKWIHRAMVIVLMAFAGLSALDLALDSPRLWRSGHALVEIALMVTALAGAFIFGRGWRAAEQSLSGVRALLDARRAERDEWQKRAQGALIGFGEAMDRQFDSWNLTPTEKETALLLLKGYSHKDAAAHTGRSERTVRQHAVNVYRKSGLSGRAQLAAFFFDGMILPTGPPVH
ncbi:MAG: helix-turn-helix transcriptional regulator [Vicinamibacteria bacterium]|jgi:DNA-binding CsgD family transcriptional regulator|nr:helix-turn-helix transcriptional regulator [Vicinamibacteria bacterium]MBP9944959.1 helix-turn-helix transcriptional regulator [Vicinamibacteria bacterium]